METPLYIKWNDNYAIGIPIIDEQHRSIVATINSLYYFLRLGQEDKMLDAIVEMLVQYTIIHFRTEETLLDAAGYPEFTGHREMHRELADRTRQIALDSHVRRDGEEVLVFLRSWWLGHINEEDRKYASFIRSRTASEDR